MKCVVITVTYTIELQDRVLAPWGLSSISAVAALVFFYVNRLDFRDTHQIKNYLNIIKKIEI